MQFCKTIDILFIAHYNCTATALFSPSHLLLTQIRALNRVSDNKFSNVNMKKPTAGSQPACRYDTTRLGERALQDYGPARGLRAYTSRLLARWRLVVA